MELSVRTVARDDAQRRLATPQSHRSTRADGDAAKVITWPSSKEGQVMTEASFFGERLPSGGGASAEAAEDGL
jgi:hypothetical protein